MSGGWARNGFTGWLLATVVAVSVAGADTTTSLGDRSGEGATPFTGLAQAPEANLFTGALTTEIPIKVPPGRKGMTPQLSLQYSSSRGASAFGRGWDLPIGRVERSTKWGNPRCSGDHVDDFIVVLPDGSAVELVADPAGSGRYRPRVEESYLSAELDWGENRWTVRDRSGLRYEFGEHSSARVATEVDGPVLAENPDGSCSLTSAWMLTHIADGNGNQVDIEWLNTNNVPLPSRILYGGNANGVDHFYRVELSYLLRHPFDLPVSHRLGVEQRIHRRLATVAVYSDVPELDTPVRTYQFYYFDDGESFSLLRSVTATAEPTQNFVYTEAAAGHASSAESIAVPVPAGHHNLRQWNDSLEVQVSILDMNGDGRLDLVHGGFFPWTVYFGSSDGSESFGFDSTPVLWSGDNGYSEGRIRNVWINTGPCDENGWACTVVDTFDITGDGRTDYVVATDAGGPWRVHAGERKPDGSWGFDTAPILWPAPDRIIRRAKGGRTYRDTIDVNGDGLPDLVDVANGVWSVWLNYGLGFEAAPLARFDAPLGSLDRSVDGSTKHMLTDFDGDGLVDMVVHLDAHADDRCDDFTWSGSLGQETNVHDCLVVHRNNGQGFSAVGEVMPIPLWTTGVTARQGGNVIADLVDISGDGLPDWVGVIDGEWEVLLNQAGRLLPVGYAAAPPHEAIGGEPWPGGSGPLRRTVARRNEIDLIDLNGDGFLDRVEGGHGSWSVRLGTLSQPPGLLSMMENGIGGTNTIVYEPSTRFDHTGGDAQPDLPFVTWVVGATRLNDGLCTPPAGADVLDPAENPCIDAGHELVSRFDYQDGLLSVDYVLDGGGEPVSVVDRGFAGFARVTRTDIDGNQTVSTFGQSELDRGKLLELYYYAGEAVSGELIRYETNQWEHRPASPLRDQVWLGRNSRITFDLGGNPHAIFSSNDEVDEWGNVLRTSVWGSSRPRVDTFTEYAVPFGANDCFPFDKPSRVYTVDPSGLLDERVFRYDGAPQGALSRGNLTAVDTWLDTESAWVTVENEYDDLGNLTEIRDALGRVSTINYDDGNGTYLYPATEINPLGHQSRKVFDYRHGLPAVAWGANGPATASVFSYDAAGRLVCESRPGAGGCSVSVTHDLAGGPGELSTITVEVAQTGYAEGRTTTTFFDALGRERYAEVKAVVAGQPMVVRRDQVEFDAAGRVRQRFYPYPRVDGAPSNGSTTFDYHLNGTQWSDPLGRVFQTVHSDGTSTRIEYYGERLVSYDETGVRSDRVLDAHNRVVREESHSQGGLYSSTTMVYDGMGRLASTYLNDSAEPLKSYTYDSMGRRIEVFDRDSGQWRFGYDHAGNLVYRDDPKPDQHVQICYDDADRPLRRCGLAEDFQTLYPCNLSCSADQTSYAYDDPSVDNSLGRLTEVDDEAGAWRVLAYDVRGRQRTTEREIVVDGDVTVGRFEWAYNQTDEVVHVTYPDGEVVTTNYDEAGQPTALLSEDGTVYVSSVWYDELGRATSIWHGNGVRDDRSYHGAAGRHRLSVIASSGPGAGFLLSQLFDYDERGQITSIADLDDGPRSNSALFGYDHLGRLTVFDSVHDQHDRTYAYDSWGNMTRRGSLDLTFDDPSDPDSAPHHIRTVDGHPVVYDGNGNRTTNATGDQLYFYDWEDRLERVWTASGDQVSFLYDHEGGRRARVVDGAGGRSVQRYYNHLVQTTSDGRTVKSYFLGGVRVATRRMPASGWQTAALDDGGWIQVSSEWHGRPVVFVELAPGMQKLLGAASVVLVLGLASLAPLRRRRVVGLRVHPASSVVLSLVLVTTALPWPLLVRPAGALCVPPPAGAVAHLHGDHLGSTLLITKSDGSALEHIRYFPFGEIRGRWNGQGVAVGAASQGESRFEFTGHEAEPTSGLVYAGSRFYDPILATFLTPDPAGEFVNPYSYVGWDPINGEDPTGECEFLCFILITFAVGFVISAAQAALDGADLGDSLLAGLIGGATSVAGATVLGPVGNAIGKGGGWLSGAVDAVRLAAAGYGTYSTVESFRDGEYLAGSLGALRAVAAAFGGFNDSGDGIGADPSVLSRAGFAASFDAPPQSKVGARMGTLLSVFPGQPAGGTVARVRTTSIVLFGIKVEVGTAWAIDSAGGREVFDVFAVGFETEVVEIAVSEGTQLTDAPGVASLAGTSTSIGGSGGPSILGFGAEYNVGGNYSGVTVYGGAQYGIAPVGAYGLRETWSVRGE